MQSLYAADGLRRLAVRHDSLVGIDSDGCVFDTMRVKQCEHFHPLIIRFWNLHGCEKQFRACAEFVNMHSKSRGSNRFPALLRTFELLAEYPGILESGVPLPDLAAMRAYVNSGLPLGNPSLKDEVERTNDHELRRLLEWSLAINADIAERMRPVPPFKWALQALKLIRAESDAIVVSQTPEEALVKEWREHGIDGYVDFIAGQELGSKDRHLRLATDGKYAAGRVLMIGDAPGDLLSARKAGALFYPVIPDQEEASWERFCGEAYGKFLDNSYSGTYAQGLQDAFEATLSDTPPWL